MPSDRNPVVRSRLARPSSPAPLPGSCRPVMEQLLEELHTRLFNKVCAVPSLARLECKLGRVCRGTFDNHGGGRVSQLSQPG